MVNEKGVSLVAFYGKKPPALAGIVQKLQQLLSNELGANFIPYQLEQVHGTIIGCEGIKQKEIVISHWFKTLREETRSIDYRGMLQYLQQSPYLPLEITFGGYQPEVDYGFLSRGEHPRDRSLAMQITSEGKGIPVIMGWSLGNKITMALDNLRRELQQFGLLHKYHGTATDIDNDFYLRLGTIEKVSVEDLLRIKTQILDYLQSITSIKVTLNQEDLTFVKYQDMALPIASTQSYSVEALASHPENFAELYE